MTAQEQLMMPLAVVAQHKLSKRGIYDAQTLKATDPEKYELIVKYLAKGCFSKRTIADAVDAAFETVVAVELDRRVDIRAGKRAMVASIDLILATNEERLLEKAETEGLSALEHAILIDKRELLSGGVTDRVGHVIEVDPEVEEFRRFSEVRDVPAMVLGMGSEGGKMLQEGGLADAPGEGPTIEASGDLIEQKAEGRDNESSAENS